MADETIKLNNENTIGVTFNKSEGNKISGATVTVTGSPKYEGKLLTNGSFNVTLTDGDLWTSTEANNNTYKSFITGSVTEDAAAAVSSLTDAAVVTQVTTAANPVTAVAPVTAAPESVVADVGAVTVAPANSGSGGGSRKASRRTKNRNSKRRGGRSKRRPRYRSTYR